MTFARDVTPKVAVRIQIRKHWIPAFAGMTLALDSRHAGQAEREPASRLGRGQRVRPEEILKPWCPSVSLRQRLVILLYLPAIRFGHIFILGQV